MTDDTLTWAYLDLFLELGSKRFIDWDVNNGELQVEKEKPLKRLSVSSFNMYVQSENKLA